MTKNDTAACAKCPKCSSPAKRITRKSNYLQTKVLPSLGFYPWECPVCRSIFMARNRGPRKERKVKTTAPIGGADSAART